MSDSSSELKQHSIPSSLLLHLVPGVFILAGIFLFSQSFIVSRFGIDSRLGPLFGYLMALLFGLLPVQLGILFYIGKKYNNKVSLKGIIGNLKKSSLKWYLILIPILLAYNFLLFVVIAPRVQPFIVKTFFFWYPENYNFQLFMRAVMQDPASIAGCQGVRILLVLYILLSCLLGPFVEELYFRGYLLPRMDGYAKKWAPFINTVLFSVYHFFSPWENCIRVVGLLPVIYIVWRRKDIRFSLITHIILNTIGGIAFLVAVLR